MMNMWMVRGLGTSSELADCVVVVADGLVEVAGIVDQDSSEQLTAFSTRFKIQALCRTHIETGTDLDLQGHNDSMVTTRASQAIESHVFLSKIHNVPLGCDNF